MHLLTNNKIFQFVIFIITVGCTDPVNIKLKQGEPRLAVDGSITDQSKIRTVPLPDTIRLTMTSGFLDGPSPVVPDATVILADNTGAVDTLKYMGSGKYITDITKITGQVGKTYFLAIFLKGEQYISTDVLQRVPDIDSIKTDHRLEAKYGRAPGYFIDFFAKDLKGRGDFYRFKVYKNHLLYNRPQDLDVSADAGFSTNTPEDSVRFIFPIREQLNPRTDSTDKNTQGDMAPYLPGDTVKIEILSLSAPTYYFYLQLQTQLLNDGLFARPSANVVTNVYNVNKASSKTATGWFSSSAISSKTIVISD